MKIKDVGLIVLAVLLAVSLGFGGYFFFRAKHIQERETAARVDAQNRIAELSRTLKEGERTWSRLAQEKDASNIENEYLTQLINDALDAIRERDEQITVLNHTIANFRPVRVVVEPGNVTQIPDETDPERVRVEFDQTWEDFMRISGFTLTNPAEAEIQVDYTRPVHLAIVVTQREDLSWNSYVSHDVPNLEIETIDTTVSPLSRPQEETKWYEGIYAGFGFGLGRELSGGSVAGFGLLELGYDFGDFEFGLLGMFNAWDSGASPGLGLTFRFNPFAL